MTVGKALQRRGHEVHVAALWGPYTLANELEEAGVTVYRLDVPHRRMFPIALFRLYTLLRHAHYDVVHGHLLFGSLYSRLAVALLRGRMVVVSTYYNLGYDSYPANTILRKFGKMVDGWTARKLEDAGICVSSLVEEHYRKNLGVSITRVYPLGVEPLVSDRKLQVFPSVSSEENCSALRIIHPARFVPEKGHRYLVEALDILRKKRGGALTVFLVGEGPLRKVIADKVQELGLSAQIQFTGQIPHSQLLTLLGSSDLLVLPSTHDGCPTVVIEAMQAGVPVVASSVGGLVDLIEHEVSGLLVPSADPEALSEAIWSVASNAILREKFIRNARERVQEKFLSDKIAVQYESLYVDFFRKKSKSYERAA